MKLFATCARGLEDVAAAEVAQVSGACATEDHAKVFFAATWRQAADLHVRARTLHKLHLLLARGPVKALEDVRALAGTVDWASQLGPGQSFGVKAARHGEHGFTSVDVGRVVGDAVIAAVRRDAGERPRVDLERPDVEVSALVRGEEAVLGVNLTGESLHKRGYRRYQHPAPLQPTLAAALLDVARWRGEGLWDPMCGSGTIVIEAAMRARRLPPNPARPFAMERLRAFPPDALAEARAAALAEAAEARPPLLGSDRSEKHLLGAAENARAAGVWDLLVLRHLDVAKALPGDLPFAPETVVMNPPYGLRIGSRRVMRRLYRDALASLVRAEPAQVVVLVGNRLFEEAAAEAGLPAPAARDIMYGDLPARLLRFQLRNGSSRGDQGPHATVI